MLFKSFVMVLTLLLSVLPICEQIVFGDITKNTFSSEFLSSLLRNCENEFVIYFDVNYHSNQQLEFVKRLVGGVPVDPSNKHPWVVTINDRSNRNLLCGGALITDRHVLTAAHCFKPYNVNPGDIRLRIGASKKNDGIKATVKKIINHENFGKPYEGRNDVAILEIDRPITLPHKEAKPICLGKKGMAEEGVLATVVGYGRTKERGGHTTDVIMQIEIPIVSNEYCVNSFEHLFSGTSMICAGMDDGSRDACQGDSGGPIMVNSNGVWYVIGVVSFGRGCGRAMSYGVYTKVDYFENWIDEMIFGTSFKRC